MYNSSLQPMTAQPDYTLGKGIEVTNMENGALILPTQQPVSSMELCVHYKTNSSFPNLQLTGGADDTTLGIYFQNYDSYLNTWISSNGSSYDIASDANIASGFVNDTEYWLKATWDGTKYEFYTSTDGINFVKSYQVINSTSPVFWNNSNLYLGNNAAKSFTQVYAKYFLDGTYLKVDGVTIFDGSLGTGYTTDGCTVSGFIKGDIKFNNTIYARSPADDKGKLSTYYAYKDGNNNIIYTKGELANQGTFTLQNASITGNLTNNAGFFKGFSQGNYLNINTTQPQNSFDLIVCANWGMSSGTYDLLKTQPDMKGILLRFEQVYAYRPIYSQCYLSSNGTSWDTLVGFDVGASFYESSIFQYVRIQWDSTSGVYTFSWRLEGDTNWTVVATSQGNLPAPYWSGNNQTIGGNTDYTEAWTYGIVDMASTSLTIDGVKTSYGTITGASTLYDSNLSPLSKRFYLDNGNIVIGDTTYTRSSTDDRQA